MGPHPARRGAEGARRDPGHDGADPRPGAARPRTGAARSRGKLATPDFRVVINERVCEGCGDCGDKSNCLSVQPVDTPYGRKTRIDQTSCNFDFSCMEGDCPAFATVVDRHRRARSRTGTSTGAVDVSDLPEPTPVVDPSRFTVRLSGIGGTGVVTVSQILGTAAMLDRPHRARPRPDRPVAEGRTGRRATSASPTTRRPRVEPRQRVGRRRAAGVRPAGRRQRLAPPRRHARPHRRHRQHPRRADRRDGRPPDHPLPGLRLAAPAARPGVAERAEPLLRRRRDHDRAVRRHDDAQHLHARRRRPGRRRAGRHRSSSSGRSSSTASPSSATSPRSGGGDGGRRPDRGRGCRRARRPATRDARRDDRHGSPTTSSTTSRAATPIATAPRSIAFAPPSRPSIPTRPRSPTRSPATSTS